MIIAMHGDPGSGKDAVGKYLVERHGFMRFAFADKLKVAAEALDPIVGFRKDTQFELDGSSVRPIRLLEAVGELGWDEAKKKYPEVRRTQQRLATEVIREHVQADFWVDYVFRQILAQATSRKTSRHANVVITDLRFPNEARMVWDRFDGDIWWVTRKDNPHDLGANAGHVSEQWHPHIYTPIENDGTLDDLYERVDEALHEARIDT